VVHLEKTAACKKIAIGHVPTFYGNRLIIYWQLKQLEIKVGYSPAMDEP
jgi:hypothetical protein